MGLDRSDIAAVLDRLEDARQAERRRDGDDRRRNVVVLTPTGQQALDTLQQAFDLAQCDLFASLDVQERAALVSLLRRLLDH